MHDHGGDAGIRRADPLGHGGGAVVCVGERRRAVDRERDEHDEALVGLERAECARRAAGELDDLALDPRELLRGDASGRSLGERLEVGLDRAHLRDVPLDRTLDLLGERVRNGEVEVAWELHVERHLEPFTGVDQDEIVKLAYLGDGRAREGILKLREALREDEAPYLDRLLAATSDLRVCRLAVQTEAGGRTVRGCLFNAAAEAKTDLGVKIRGLEAPVVTGTPVGAPPNLLVEQVLGVPGELPTQTGLAFSARVAAEGGSPLVWEAVADRADLLR